MSLKSRLAAYRALREQEKIVNDEIARQEAKTRKATYTIHKDDPFDPNRKDTLIDTMSTDNMTSVVTSYKSIPMMLYNIGSKCTIKYDTKGDVSVEFSYDMENWEPYEDSKPLWLDFNQKLYFRGSLMKPETQFTIIGGAIKLMGNAMSLLLKEGFEFKMNINNVGQFKNLFKGCTTIISADDFWLTATILTPNCYESMFDGCANLGSVNRFLLPASRLVQECYAAMFRGTHLKATPSVRYEIGGPGVLSKMFADCELLESAGDIQLFDARVYNNELEETFSNCTSLVYINEHMVSHAEVILSYGMRRTFEYCGIEKAPYLTFTAVEGRALQNAFLGCRNLNEIWVENFKHSGGSYGEAFLDWCLDVAEDGIFHCNAEAEWPDGASGNPWPVLPVSVELSADPRKGSVSGPTEAYIGDIIEVSASYNPNWHFQRWSDGVTSNPRNILVKGPIRLEAIFESDPMAIEVIYDPRQVDYAGPLVARLDDVISMKAIPHYGYTFDEWSDGVTDNPRREVIVGPISVGINTHPNHYDINVIFNHEEGDVIGPRDADYLESVDHTAIPMVGFAFKNWGDGKTDNPHTMTIYGKTSIQANFVKVLLPIRIEYDETMGDVIGPREAYIGDVVRLTAVPKDNYAFKEWEDGSTSPVRDLTITGEMHVKAIFTRIPAVIDLVFDPTMGVVNGPTSGYVGDTLEYVATAIAPYEFVGWGDGDKTNPRQLYIDDTHMTLEAIFE